MVSMKASIFAAVSIISTTTGKSWDNRKILVVWIRLDKQKPVKMTIEQVESR